MAALNGPNVLRVQVLEDSGDGAVFVVQVRCQDPGLLGFWRRKPFFQNGQVEQMGAPRWAEGGGLDFVLCALHRRPRVSNAHYWSPFVMGLCLDARLFRYRLAPGQVWNGVAHNPLRENTLVLMR